jgi:hypothetical protein
LDNEAVVEYKIRSRTRPVLEGMSAFRFFDGAQMTSYFYPSKASEVVYCRGNEQSSNCLGKHESDLHPKLEVAEQLQDVEQHVTNLGAGGTSLSLSSSVSLIGFSPKAFDLSRKLNTKHISIATASTTQPLGWTSLWIDLMSPGVSELHPHQVSCMHR